MVPWLVKKKKKKNTETHLAETISENGWNDSIPAIEIKIYLRRIYTYHYYITIELPLNKINWLLIFCFPNLYTFDKIVII